MKKLPFLALLFATVANAIRTESAGFRFAMPQLCAAWVEISVNTGVQDFMDGA